MPQVYNWQTPSELRQLDQQLMAQLTLQSELFGLFPVRGIQGSMLTWWQRDNYQGLMQMRGYDGDFPRVPGVQANQYTKVPGVYGERDDIREFELTTRTAPGTLGAPIAIDELVAERIEKLVNRRVNRMTWVLAQLITTGAYIVPGADGAILDKDAYLPQRYTAPVAWATSATARPLNDFRNVQLLQRGSSVTFGTTAKALMNQATFNSLMTNTNPNDFGGIKAQYGQTVQGLGLVNTVLMQNNLPQITIDDTGYIDESNGPGAPGVFRLWLPDNVVILVGKRMNGAAIGEFLLTRNVSNANNSSEPLIRVVDRGAGPNDPPPRRIEVYSGVNAGPVVYYPGSVVVLSV
jgi:hypothetical protein